MSYDLLYLIEEDVPLTNIQEVLRPFGITPCYKGYRYIVYAVNLAVTDEFRLEAIIKEIYMETAAHFDCNWATVERNIRTIVNRAWAVNPNLLSNIAGYPLYHQPTISEFLEILVSYILRSHDPE